MKKYLFLLLTVLLVGCSSASGEDNLSTEQIEDIIETGLSNVEIYFNTGETLKSILSDITLTNEVEVDERNLSVEWESSNTNVISSAGDVTPDRNIKVDVTLTATISFEGISNEKTFDATVLEFDSDNTAYSRALQYFRNSSFDPSDSLPNSITDSSNYQTALNNLTKCANESDLDSNFSDYCFTKANMINTQSDAYEDILEVINTFSVVKNYSSLAEDIATSPEGEISRNQTLSVPSFGAQVKVLNTGVATEDSYTFATNVNTNIAGANLDLSLQNELKFNESTNEFTANYTFEITAGYSLFNVSLYSLNAQITTNSMYELKSLEIASEIPVLGSKMTKMIVNDDSSIELFSYRENLILSDYKSYIYADNDFGVSYYWTSGNPLNPFSGEKSSYEIFTPQAKIYELNFKGGENEDDTGAAKFYFSGINNFDRLEVNKPLLWGYWGFKITQGLNNMEHINEAAGNADFRIEKESAYTYVDSLDSNGNLIGFEREKTNDDVYYVAVYNNNLYSLPQSLLDFGLRTQVTNIETSMNTMKSRLNSLTIMNKSIFENPGEETGAKITVTIPGINKDISL